MRASKILSLSLLSIGLHACFLDDEKTETPKSSVSDQCGEVALALGNDFTNKVGKLYAQSLGNGGCKWSTDVYHDSRVVAHGDMAYVLEASGKITQIRIADGSLLKTFRIDSASNPHDAAFLNDSIAVIAQYNSPRLLKINTRSWAIVDSLDLSAEAAEGAKSPNAEDLLVTNQGLYLITQGMTADYKSVKPQVLQIDPSTFKIKSKLALKTTNPFQITTHDGKLLVVGKGNTDYDASWNETSRLDGGIESIDFALTSSTIVMDEKQLKAKPVQIEFAQGDKAYVSRYIAFGTNPVYSVQLSSSSLSDSLAGVSNAWGGMAYAPLSQKLLVANDDGKSAAVLAFDANGVSTRLFEGMLPAYSLTVRP